MRAPKTVLIGGVVLTVTAATATILKAQQRFGGGGRPAATATTASNASLAQRSSRQLLMNGLDYLDKYNDHERALVYLREAQRRPAGLDDAEIKTLGDALDRAEQAAREAGPTEVAAAPQPRRPIGSRRDMIADAPSRDDPVRRVSAEAVAEPSEPPAMELPALPSETLPPATDDVPPPVDTAANKASKKAADPIYLTSSNAADAPAQDEKAPADTPPTEGPPPVDAPPPQDEKAPVPPPIDEPQGDKIPATAPTRQDPKTPTLPPADEPPQDEKVPAPAPAEGPAPPPELPSASPSGPVDAPAEPPALPPADAPAPAAPRVAAAPRTQAPADVKPIEDAPADAPNPAPAQPSGAAPTQQPAPAPTDAPAPAADELPPLPDEPKPAGSPISSNSTLSPESLRAVEEVARRQEEDARRNPPTFGQVVVAPGGSNDNQNPSALTIPRPPSPTEPRPIRVIPVPEDFVPLPKRVWEPNRKYWAAAATCHMPLYFQDAVLERYGQGVEQAIGPNGRYFSYPLDDPRQSNQRNQLLQPLYSAGMFITQIAALPYNMVMDPPWEAQYDLGYYRPGDKIPGDTYYLPKQGIGPPLRGNRY